MNTGFGPGNGARRPGRVAMPGAPAPAGMPRRWLLPLLLAAALGSAQSAAETHDGDASIEDIQRQTRELMQSLKSYGADQRDEALQRIEAAQRSLDARIEKLERRIAGTWNEMDQAARDRSLASLQALRQQRTRVAEYYGSLKTSSAAAWGRIRQGFSAAYGALHDAWQEAEDEFARDR